MLAFVLFHIIATWCHLWGSKLSLLNSRSRRYTCMNFSPSHNVHSQFWHSLLNLLNIRRRYSLSHVLRENAIFFCLISHSFIVNKCNSSISPPTLVQTNNYIPKCVRKNNPPTPFFGTIEWYCHYIGKQDQHSTEERNSTMFQ